MSIISFNEKTKKVGDLEITTSQSYNGDRIYLTLKGVRFTIAKNYANTLVGREQMNDFLSKFKKQSDVDNYFKAKLGVKYAI